MDADDLREIIRDLIPWLDEANHARLADDLVDRATRNTSVWSPEGPTDEEVSEVVAFAEAARRVGQADPDDVDDYLRRGSHAFLGKDYAAAHRIFRVLLPPVGNADIDLGQHEMADEVLGVELAYCAAQYVVCAYMTAEASSRAEGVLAAIEEVRELGHFWEPLGALERVAVEALPAFSEFLSRWRELVEQRVRGQARSDWGTDEDRWLREVIGRMEGVEGLARLAKSTKRGDDLCAWCVALVEGRDWKGALRAHEEAADLVTDERYWRSEFFDGAARAAHELGRKDLPARLERAWRAGPSMVRLCRWLGIASSKKAIRQRASRALEACEERAHRQRALLHVLLGDPMAAAELLAQAPGLGWSDDEHPGHLIFPLFASALAGGAWATDLGDDEEERVPSWERDRSGLEAPRIDEIIECAGVAPVGEGRARTAMLSAMRKAAEKRIRGVTENKRRRYYGHAASLALECVRSAPTPESRAWLAALRHGYRRYPALQREFFDAEERQ